MISTTVETGTRDDDDDDVGDYNAALKELGYGASRDGVDNVEDGTTYYDARAIIITTDMNAAAMVFEPESTSTTMQYDDDNENDTGGKDAAMLIAQNESRSASFVVASGAQAHNLQNLEAFGFERSLYSATGFFVNQPIRVAGSPSALIDGECRLHVVEHAGLFEATTEDGLSIIIQAGGE